MCYKKQKEAEQLKMVKTEKKVTGIIHKLKGLDINCTNVFVS